ncbi:MAG: outer membrane lipoprotein carrier protein LolA [Pseudomonadota bacterium]
MSLLLTALFPLLVAAADQASDVAATPTPIVLDTGPRPETSPRPEAASPIVIAETEQPSAASTQSPPVAQPEAELEVDAQLETEESLPPVDAAPDTIPADAPPPAPQITRDDILAKANASLEGVASAKGGFLQISPDGATARGDFYLRRPGRIRFEYADPTPLLIIADGVTVAIEDTELETVDRAPLNSTPLDLFLKKRINLAEDGDVVDVRHVDGRFYVALEDNSGEAEGRLILEFSEADFGLQGWTTVDPSGGVTRVALFDIETGVRLPARLFVIEDPEDEDDRRR